MAKLQPILKAMFAEADTCPDNHISIDELVRWVGHCEQVQKVFQRYEPANHVGVHESVLVGMHDALHEERRLVKRHSGDKKRPPGKERPSSTEPVRPVRK